MQPIPIYLKTADDAPRPNDPIFYWMTRDDLFLCRTHSFFASDVPAPQMPQSLAPHQPRCVLHYPRLGVTALEKIVGFFGCVFDRHQAESVALLYWDLTAEHYRVYVPEQEATVWKSWTGRRFPTDVRYSVPLSLPSTWLLVADIHCHGTMAAYTSHTDHHDARFRDGVHAVVGMIDQEPPQFHLDLHIDGCRFGLKFNHFFCGYQQRRHDFPASWLDRVHIVVEPSTWQPVTQETRTSQQRTGTLANETPTNLPANEA